MPRLDSPPTARPGAPSFEVLASRWPHRVKSTFHRVGPITWHIQRFDQTGSGQQRQALLIHGTGAATHSFMDLAPLMADQFTVFAVDLPGHGFTQAPPAFLPNQDSIARAMADLLAELDMDPTVIVGHSAGAAVMLALAETLGESDRFLISLNGALTPFPGLAQMLFPVTAQVLSLGGLTAHLLAQSARTRRRVLRLLDQTGGAPDDRFVDRYWALLQCSGHISGTLRLMANWDLSAIENRLRRLDDPILFLNGSQDQAVDPADGERLAGIARQGRSMRLDRLGHLAHEQDAQRVWQSIALALNTKETA